MYSFVQLLKRYRKLHCNVNYKYIPYSAYFLRHVTDIPARRKSRCNVSVLQGATPEGSKPTESLKALRRTQICKGLE